MTCNNCGHQLNEGDKFCSQCGTPVPQEKRCSKCQAILADDDIFCSQCGTRYGAAPQPDPQPYYPPHNPHNQNTFGGNANQSQYQNNGYNPGYNPAQPKKHMLISKYIGEPTVGIAKATGTLYVYQDRLEYVKQLGNALGGGIGAIGMAAAANKMKKEEGKVEVFYFQDIQTAYVGKYAALMPAVVLVMNDGQVFSFNGSFTNQSAANIVNTILYNK